MMCLYTLVGGACDLMPTKTHHSETSNAQTDTLLSRFMMESGDQKCLTKISAAQRMN